MRYHLDTDCLSIQSYKDLLQRQNLLPGRRCLLENMDHHFGVFESRGIQTVTQLRKSLSSPHKIQTFASDSGISENYLILLKREMGSLEQKPVSLADFPGVDASLTAKLIAAGIKTSKDYFEAGHAESNELLCLCDLVRINGVGPVAARAFYDAGYQSVSSVACADAATMLEKVTGVNEARHYYKAKLGLKDMQFCIDFAQLLERFCT